MVKRISSLLAAAAMAFALTGCGERVEVPPANIGKVMTSKGYQEGFQPTSKFRLDTCWAGTACDKLVLLDVSDRSKAETIEVFMPEDKLLMSVQIQTTLQVNPKKAESLFNTLPQTAKEGEDQIATIAWDTIYNTYARQIIIAEAAEFVSKFNIPHIASNRETVNAQLRQHLTKQIEARTPFTVRFVGLTDVKYPEMIVQAQLNAAKRREQIQQEEAELEVSKVKLERELQEARLNRQIEIEKAETEAAAQRAQSQTITSAVLELRRIENDRLKLEKWNGVLPTTVMGDNASVLKQLP
jgi:predicted small lipoprotein YifL